MNKQTSPNNENKPWAADLFADSATSEQQAAPTAHIVLDELSADETHVVQEESLVPATATFGARLRAAREARGADISSCTQALHLPSRVLQKLEADEYAGMDSHVYLRSYLLKYATYLGLPRDAVEAHLEHLPSQQEVLVSTGGITRSRYLLERYATAATYVVLTAVIVVPIVWIGLKGGLDRDVARLAPLDASPIATRSSSTHAGGPRDAARMVASVPDSTSAGNEQPLQASLAPFEALDRSPAPAPSMPPAADSTGKHSVSLELPAPSWVEITTADGQRLEYGLLPAGTHKIYRSSGPLNVSIGNADGAAVSIDGGAVDLQQYQHANVARFRVKIAHGKAAPQSM